MIRENLVWMGNTEKGDPVSIIPKMANRHGLIAGATGTGKTVTIKVMAESFSDMGVPIFMADAKGDIAGMMDPGTDSEDMQSRIAKFGLGEAGFSYKGCPVALWDIYGQKGVQLRTTISEMGPLLLSRVLDLNDLQSDILSVIFKIADDNGLLLIDTKDLKSMIHYVDQHAGELAAEYGKISSASLGVITRAIVTLETAGGDVFFGEPALTVTDWLAQDGGRGVINILDSTSLVTNGRLYSAFLLWFLAELYETLPEVGDQERPKMVFFFDEAHLLFTDASKALMEKVEQLVKMIRSKGVGVFFSTQNPRDIPDSILAQLGNKVEHGLHAYTPADQKAVKAAAESFRENPAFDTYDTILNLGTGEAVVSFLGEDGVPAMAEKVSILPPQCSMGSASDAAREQCIKGSLAYSRYATAVDNESAYEILERKGLEAQQQAEQEAAQGEADKAQAAEEKEAAKLAAQEAKEAQKQAEKEAKELEKQRERELKEAQKAQEKAEREAQRLMEKEERERQRRIKSVGNTVAGTIGREVGKSMGKNFGSFGKTLGGNTGASIARGLLDTLLSNRR